MSEWTQEPWEVKSAWTNNEYLIGQEKSEYNIAVACDGVNGLHNAEANARRIVACVNANAGIPTKVLEDAAECAAAGRFGTMAAMYKAQRDNLLDALGDLIKAFNARNENEIDRIIAESNALIKRVKEEL